jgi:hypothetical protein
MNTTRRLMHTTSLRGLLVIGLLGLVPVLASTGLAQAAGGNTYAVDGATGGSPSCASAANNPALPFAKIGDALTCVNADGTTATTPDTITIAVGTYYEAGLKVSAYVNIQGQAGSTIINALKPDNTQLFGSVLTITAPYSVSISGLTITNGLSCSSLGCGGLGGGIFNGGTLTISNSTLSGNTACSGGCAGAGGGIANFFFATLTISNSTLSNNTGCSGSNCNGQGGGIDNFGTLSVTNSTLGGKASATGNIACSGSGCFGQGGGLWNDSNDPGFGSPNPVTLTNDTITNNAAFPMGTGSGGGGGGIYNFTGSPSLQNDTIKSNTPDNCGGPVSLTGCKG